VPTIDERYVALHPRSAELHRRAVATFPNGVTHDIRRQQPFPLYVERAAGSRKWDVDGNEIIDYVMGHGALLLGHCRAEVVAAVQDQAARGTHYGASHELEVRWGELVRSLVPSAEVVRFTSSGTEATMMAVRLARAFTGRPKLVRFAGHFHGWNDNVVGFAPQESTQPRAPGVPAETLSNVVLLRQHDEAAVRDALAARDVAAVILEPTGAAWGTVPLNPAFLRFLREVTASTSTLLIFDEVVTGFRVAPGGAQERFGVTPDLTTLAKVLAGGLPGGAVCGRRDVMSMLEFRDDAWNIQSRVSHPGTFNANPLSAAAGVACLEIVRTGAANEAADAACRTLVRALNDVIRRSHVPGCAYGQASMFHIILGQEAPAPADGFAWQWGDDMPERLPHTSPAVEAALKLAMLNEGVDLMHGGGLVSAAHDGRDVFRSAQAFERALAALRADGVL